MYDGPRIFLDVTRATQLGTWTGWIETPDLRIEMEAGTYGTKDRSWGVRPIGEPLPGAPGTRAAQLCFLWAPINFDDRGVHFMTFDDSDGRPLSRTAVELALEGHGEPVHRQGRIEVVPETGSRRPTHVTLALDDEQISLTPLSTLQMRGVGYGHPSHSHGWWHGGPFVIGEVLDQATLDPLEYHNLHVEQVVRADWNGRSGLGVLESLIVGPYEPMGLTGLFDGA